MSVRGIKRPLSDEDDQNSPEDLLTLLRDSEDESSPVCLLSAQPVSDSEDESSPECPLSVGDNYSSDDNSHKVDHMKTLKKRKAQPPAILSARSDSSEFTGPQVLFFFDLDYEPQPEPSDISKLSVTSILGEMFRFICTDDKEVDSEGGETEFKVNGKTMEQIYAYHLKDSYFLSWMKQNDVLDFKVTPVDQWMSQMARYYKEAQCLRNGQRAYVVTVITLLGILYEQYALNGCTDPDWMKELFRQIEVLVKVTSNPLHVVRRSNSRAKYELMYIVPETLASPNCARISSNSRIVVRPDVVFGTQNSWDLTSNTGRIVIQIFPPRRASMSAEKEVPAYERTRQDENDKSLGKVKKPERKQDAILTQDYVDSAYKYLRASVPVGCEDHQTLTALTAHHVLQLIALTAEQDHATRTQHFNKANMPNPQAQSDNPQLQPLGLFLKNELVIFSKLVLSPSKLDFYFGDFLTAETGAKTHHVGKVAYSYWSLDLLQANHRMAFFVCLLELLQPEPKS